MEGWEGARGDPGGEVPRKGGRQLEGTLRPTGYEGHEARHFPGPQRRDDLAQVRAPVEHQIKNVNLYTQADRRVKPQKTIRDLAATPGVLNVFPLLAATITLV